MSKFYEYNFLPAKEYYRRKIKRIFIYLFLDLAISSMLFVLFYSLLSFDIDKKIYRNLNIISKKINKLKNFFALLQKNNIHLKENLKYLNKQKFVNSINYSIIFELEKYIPENLSLSYLKISKNSIKVKGYSNSRNSIFKFLNNLKGNKYKITNFNIKLSKKIIIFEVNYISRQAENL